MERVSDEFLDRVILSYAPENLGVKDDDDAKALSIYLELRERRAAEAKDAKFRSAAVDLYWAIKRPENYLSPVLGTALLRLEAAASQAGVNLD
jgi:hypothetical protein